MNTEADNRGSNGKGSDAIVQKSHEAAANLKQATLERVDTVRRSAQSLRDDTSESVRKLGAAIHKVGEHFRIEDQQSIAELMTDASQRVHAVADYVGSAQLGSLVHDTRNMARDNTALFLGGAFLVGLGTGRFFKGTSMTARPMNNNRESRAAARRSPKSAERSNRSAPRELEASSGTSKAGAPARTSRDPRI